MQQLLMMLVPEVMVMHTSLECLAGLVVGLLGVVGLMRIVYEKCVVFLKKLACLNTFSSHVAHLVGQWALILACKHNTGPLEQYVQQIRQL